MYVDDVAFPIEAIVLISTCKFLGRLDGGKVEICLFFLFGHWGRTMAPDHMSRGRVPVEVKEVRDQSLSYAWLTVPRDMVYWPGNRNRLGRGDNERIDTPTPF